MWGKLETILPNCSLVLKCSERETMVNLSTVNAMRALHFLSTTSLYERIVSINQKHKKYTYINVLLNSIFENLLNGGKLGGGEIVPYLRFGSVPDTCSYVTSKMSRILIHFI